MIFLVGPYRTITIHLENHQKDKGIYQMATDNNTPNHLRPWEVVDSAELKRLRKVEGLAMQLKRGCHCEYDYRCGNCDTIVKLREYLEANPSGR